MTEVINTNDVMWVACNPREGMIRRALKSHDPRKVMRKAPNKIWGQSTGHLLFLLKTLKVMKKQGKPEELPQTKGD